MPPFADDRSTWATCSAFGFAIVLLLGAAREIQAYWRSRVEAAALEERRRVARDLHDGLAQELAFIATRAKALAAEHDHDPGLAQLANAGQRALDESRRAVASLTRPVDEPLDVALAQAAEDVALRTGATVELALASNVVVTPARREALVRITREAITNAARHADAGTIRVELATSPTLRLRVVDDGSGFDQEAPRPASTGSGSRACASGPRAWAVRSVSSRGSAPGHVVEVVLP